jgi:hypothetical protein
VNLGDLVITEEELDDGADLKDHAKEVARFLADLENDHRLSVPDSPGRSMTTLPMRANTLTENKTMAGI